MESTVYRRTTSGEGASAWGSLRRRSGGQERIEDKGKIRVRPRSVFTRLAGIWKFQELLKLYPIPVNVVMNEMDFTFWTES
ncbi:hypothetical protein TNCV_4693671 [Trichonephila clavipes]|uniref:Uncharacterized protein n=1 Tax=Trichonephila clavipes TaxID=2585209 RepID=A0A8X6WAQ3_TRICX|nr:hypothetical protein TNCV_4693671 [Trichonephila clavipes]